ISAPRPLPKPERAMRLRLPEQSSQRKQQSDRALFLLFGGFGNTVLGWRSNFSAVGASFSTGAGAGTLAFNTGIRTRPLALLLCHSTAMATETQRLEISRCSITRVISQATDHSTTLSVPLRSTTTRPDSVTTPVGDSALELNTNAAENTAIGDLALRNNDATGAGDANNNMAVGASTMFNNVNGSENTAVGAGVGPNLVVCFNSTYVGDFVGSTEPDGVIPLPDEDSTIRIGDISNGNGPGPYSAASVVFSTTTGPLAAPLLSYSGPY